MARKSSDPLPLSYETIKHTADWAAVIAKIAIGFSVIAMVRLCMFLSDEYAVYQSAFVAPTFMVPSFSRAVFDMASALGMVASVGIYVSSIASLMRRRWVKNFSRATGALFFVQLVRGSAASWDLIDRWKHGTSWTKTFHYLIASGLSEYELAVIPALLWVIARHFADWDRAPL